MGPRTEPCGTPQGRGVVVDRCGGIQTVKEREDRYEVNQFRTVEEMPNQVERR